MKKERGLYDLPEGTPYDDYACYDYTEEPEEEQKEQGLECPDCLNIRRRARLTFGETTW